MRLLGIGQGLADAAQSAAWHVDSDPPRACVTRETAISRLSKQYERQHRITVAEIDALGGGIFLSSCRCACGF